jgi:hypothetical protein
MSRTIIRKIRFAHCKRGPATCETCQETDVERLCLLAVYPPEAGMIQRRLIQVQVDGEGVWQAFEVLRVFEDEQEASAYAQENEIGDVQL